MNPSPQLKESIRDGSLTKEDVLEFEKISGVEVGQMVKMLDSAQGRGLSAEMKDTIEVMRELSRIKAGK